MKFYKKHKRNAQFWDYSTKSWLKKLPTTKCIIITNQGYNIHPSLWDADWFSDYAIRWGE